MESPTQSECTWGAIYGLVAVCIWGGFIVVSDLGVRTSLTPWDVAAIRLAVAGVLLLPYLAKKFGAGLNRPEGTVRKREPSASPERQGNRIVELTI